MMGQKWLLIVATTALVVLMVGGIWFASGGTSDATMRQELRTSDDRFLACLTLAKGHQSVATQKRIADVQAKIRELRGKGTFNHNEERYERTDPILASVIKECKNDRAQVFVSVVELDAGGTAQPVAHVEVALGQSPFASMMTNRDGQATVLVELGSRSSFEFRALDPSTRRILGTTVVTSNQLEAGGVTIKISSGQVSKVDPTKEGARGSSAGVECGALLKQIADLRLLEPCSIDAYPIDIERQACAKEAASRADLKRQRAELGCQ